MNRHNFLRISACTRTISLSVLIVFSLAATARAVDLDAEWRAQFEDLRIQIERLDTFRKAQGEALREEACILPTDRDPLDIVLRRTEAVLHEVRRLAPKADLAGAEAELNKLREQATRTELAAEARYDLFTKVCLLRRRIALANPLLDFRDIVFVTRGPV